ncbi:MAG: hypothetical protein KIS76_16525 [Pyrinomonadaceae bacterium]|nr:hypothetical protein [Pyrinomonadaceae bacterium]
MKIILSLTLLILGFSNFAFSQDDEKESSLISVNICQPSLTEAGRQSSFRFNYVYRIITGKTGSVKDVKEVLDHKKFQHLMDDKDVIPCIEKWKLKPSETYILTISVGTTGEENSLNISSKTVKIKFIL